MELVAFLAVEEIAVRILGLFSSSWMDAGFDCIADLGKMLRNPGTPPLLA
jgi:hypothetical protein